jgi:hypothetical protein
MCLLVVLKQQRLGKDVIMCGCDLWLVCGWWYLFTLQTANCPAGLQAWALAPLQCHECVASARNPVSLLAAAGLAAAAELCMVMHV